MLKCPVHNTVVAITVIKIFCFLISFLYVCMVNTIYLLSFVETPRNLLLQSFRSVSSDLHQCYNNTLVLYYYSTDEDPSLRIESSAIINLRGVSTKLNKYILFFV